MAPDAVAFSNKGSFLLVLRVHGSSSWLCSVSSSPQDPGRWNSLYLRHWRGIKNKGNRVLTLKASAQRWYTSNSAHRPEKVAKPNLPSFGDENSPLRGRRGDCLWKWRQSTTMDWRVYNYKNKPANKKFWTLQYIHLMEYYKAVKWMHYPPNTDES